VERLPDPRAGRKDLYETFMIDSAIGMNAATKNPEAAKIFLEWLETKDFNDTFANNVPGFFPMSKPHHNFRSDRGVIPDLQFKRQGNRHPLYLG